ncbi:hypothetical protein K0M31_020024 [Melipona bicolor]|uniref:Uncharacterized protein n=1 Tax=Melipona bicolor TaxID=60889 RepID=A0AA40G0L7_9HYME|nr:hypothetical protein K0M31_020024 [Melipona bicolor]
MSSPVPYSIVQDVVIHGYVASFPYTWAFNVTFGSSCAQSAVEFNICRRAITRKPRRDIVVQMPRRLAPSSARHVRRLLIRQATKRRKYTFDEDVRIRKDLGAYCPIVQNEFIGQLHGTTSTDISIWNVYDDNELRTSHSEGNDYHRRDIVKGIICDIYHNH